MTKFVIFVYVWNLSFQCFMDFWEDVIACNVHYTVHSESTLDLKSTSYFVKYNFIIITTVWYHCFICLIPYNSI